ncbi:MAG: FixH family protein [Gammaproteobacteria bacterium]|nr:FixH family protein [Gammaproteobacteria bacterium]
MSKPPFFSQSSKSALHNPWVIGWLAALLLVIGVNAAFIITAFVTAPGLVNENYYERGQAYEKNRLKLNAIKSELDWQPTLQLPERFITQTSQIVRLQVEDKNQQPLNADKVMLTAYRPSDASLDFTVEMVPVVDGLFQATLKLPLQGMWELHLAITADNHTLDMVKRVKVHSP